MKRPQFSIRELLLVTTIVGLTMGWWLDHRNQANRIAALEQSSTTKMVNRLLRESTVLRDSIVELQSERNEALRRK
jgi:hypothetical protein